MKNRLYAGCIWAVVLAGLFVHLRDPLIAWLHSSDSAAAKELLENIAFFWRFVISIKRKRTVWQIWNKVDNPEQR